MANSTSQQTGLPPIQNQTNINNKIAASKKSISIGGEIYFSAVSVLDVALSMRHLSLMLKSGLALNEALQVLATQTTDQRLKHAYQDMLKNANNGLTLTESMKMHKKIFTEIVISIVNVGERGGTLEKNLAFLADYLKKAHELKKKVKGALIYPAIVLSMTMLEIFGVIFFILPRLEELFTSFSTIPPLTKGVLQFSQFVRDNALFIGLGLIIFGFAFTAFFRTKTGKIIKDNIGLKFPVIKKLNKNNLIATFSRTLAILLESGIPITRGLEITSETVGNTVYEEALKKVFENVKSGNTLASSLEKYPKLFPPTFIKMIEVGEKTGALEENLNYLYDYHSEEVEDMTSNLTTLIEPILLIFAGGMIGFLALIIIGPIYQFTGNINSGV